MRVAILLTGLLIMPDVGLSDSLVATRTLRGGDIIGPNDFNVSEITVQGAFDSSAHIVGLEAQVAIYSGQPIHIEDLASPTLVARNQPVMLRYQRGGVFIATEARALGEGRAGDTVRVMNLASKSTVSGTIQQDGSVEVK